MYGYANLLFLLDVNAFVLTIDVALASRQLLQEMFRAIGTVDAAQSIAVWRSTLPTWCVPEFVSRSKSLHATGVVHPLVADAVPNDVTIEGRSLLITGSNMSGKTTLVRALGVNAVLAQTVGTACAASWRSPLLAVAASIGRDDSVMEGKSYYLAEVESVGRLVNASSGERQGLFLLDEIFRGTNTPERVAGAYAVLDYLNRGTNLVVVATHDIELMGLLRESYAPHHFREQVDGGELTFDYVMRAGTATTRNAIALLEAVGYPRELVAAARGALGRGDAG